MRSKVLMRWAFCALVVAVLASACGGGDGSDEVIAAAAAPAQSDADGDAADSDAGADESASDDESDDEEDGEPETLQDILGNNARLLQGGGRGSVDADAAIEQQRAIEQALRVCMAAQGWDYTPEDVEAQGPGRLAGLAAVGAELSPEDFAAQYGFGISTRFDELLEQGPAAFGVGPDAVSANDEYLATLSETEADAWRESLNGEPPERDAEGRLIDPETGEPLEGGQGRGNRVTGGCRAEANEEVRGDLSALAELADEFEQLEARIDADPRINEIRAEWTDCMTTAGHDYATVQEARQSIQTEFRGMVRTVFRSLLRPGGQDQGDDNADVGATGLSAEQAEQLDQLQELERAVGAASFACGGTANEEVAAIRARYEAEFIDQNRAALESVGS